MDSTHNGTCPCGLCGSREDEENRRQALVVEELPASIEPTLDDFLGDAIFEACGRACYTLRRGSGVDFTAAALRELRAICDRRLGSIA